MAPTKCLFPVLLLLPMLAATSTADHHRWLIPRLRPRPEEPAACLPGQDFPVYAMPRCRAYLTRKCVSDQVAEGVRQECCRQLAAVQEPRCKCRAIAHMLDIMYRGLGVEGGKQKQQQEEAEEAFPGCRTFMLSQVAARLPIVCGQEVPLSGSVCSWATNSWSA
uniref:Uncharacterized protein n=1 Tax=Avena sativa TaxID=4498 RepID=A0ACD5XE82_AVESA